MATVGHYTDEQMVAFGNYSQVTQLMEQVRRMTNSAAHVAEFLPGDMGADLGVAARRIEHEIHVTVQGLSQKWGEYLRTP